MPKVGSEDFEVAGLLDGEGCIGRVYVSVQRPRLKFEDMAWKDGRATKTWIVDGVRCASLEEAERMLQVPPELTPEEAALLAEVGTEWVPGSEFIGYGDSLMILPGTREARRSEISRSLDSKGLLEWENGNVRRRVTAGPAPTAKPE
jgi:hypothetical protein